MTYDVNEFLDLVIYLATDATSQLFEGDIQLTPEDLAFMKRQRTNSKRNAQRMRQGVWRTKVIPYEIDTLLGKCICTLIHNNISTARIYIVHFSLTQR